MFVNLAPNVYYTDTTDNAILDYLTSNLYTGHGAHSMFMKTWAAGLAYSNGLRRSLDEGVIEYYAERCPLLPQTLRFVIDQLKKGSPIRTSRVTRSQKRSTRASRSASSSARVRWRRTSPTA